MLQNGKKSKIKLNIEAKESYMDLLAVNLNGEINDIDDLIKSNDISNLSNLKSISSNNEEISSLKDSDTQNVSASQAKLFSGKISQIKI